jgi:hypothetical protein
VCVEGKALKESLVIYRKMKAASVLPNWITYGLVFEAMVGLERWDLASHLVKEVRSMEPVWWRPVAW